MNKIFILIFSLVIPSLLIASIYRKAIDKPPLTLTNAINILSSADIDFSNTVETFEKISSDLNNLKPTRFQDIESIEDLFTKLGSYIVNFIRFQADIIAVPLTLVFDIFELVYSIYLMVWRFFGIDLPKYST